MSVMIGVDPHKGSHTAVAVDATEGCLGELRVRSGPGQADRLLEWAASFAKRTWAIENAAGLGYLLAQQLVAAGERVVDVQPKLAARVRLLATEATNKNDPHDARSAVSYSSGGCHPHASCETRSSAAADTVSLGDSGVSSDVTTGSWPKYRWGPLRVVPVVVAQPGHRRRVAATLRLLPVLLAAASGEV